MRPRPAKIIFHGEYRGDRLSLPAVQFIRNARGIYTRPHGLPQYLLLFFYDPCGIRTSAGGILEPWPANTAILYRPGAFQQYGEKCASWDHAWFLMEGSSAAPILEASGTPLERPVPFPTPAPVERLFDGLREELSAPASPDAGIISALVTEFFHRFRRAGQEHDSGKAIPPAIAGVKRELDGAYHEPQSLGELAMRHRLSIPNLCLLFKRHYGVPVMEYVIRRRLGEAKSLLTHTTLRVQEVASAVGYENLFYFSRLFKRHAGAGPLAWRKSGKENRSG